MTLPTCWRRRRFARIEYGSRFEFVQCNLRLFAGLYVVWRYADVLRERGIADPQRLFACQEFSDVRHLIDEVTKKK